MQTLNDKVQKFVFDHSDGNVVINQMQADDLIKLCRDEDKPYTVKLYEHNGQTGNYDLVQTFSITARSVIASSIKYGSYESKRGYYRFLVEGLGLKMDIYTSNRNFYLVNG